MDSLEQMSSKDIAGQLSDYDWELFSTVHEVGGSTQTHRASRQAPLGGGGV